MRCFVLLSMIVFLNLGLAKAYTPPCCIQNQELPFEVKTIFLEGTVQGIRLNRPQMMSAKPGIQVDVDGKIYFIRLGPAWYLEEHGIFIKNGDQLQILGNK